MTASFLSEDFLLYSKSAKRLYHEYAKEMPIFDYHCHLPPEDIAENRRFANLTQIWLSGDHYKWRAMRTNGVAEQYITGAASDEEKFKAWAATVPYTIRNPIYHWTHLELTRIFGIADQVLNPETAATIYNHGNQLLKTDEFRARRIMERMNVKVVCTTDDPLSDLRYHQQIRKDTGFAIKVLPTFRPDEAMAVESAGTFNAWVAKLEQLTGIEVKNVEALIEAIRKRHQFFHENGCRISDHAVEFPYAEEYTAAAIEDIFVKVRKGSALERSEVLQFKSALLYECVLMNAAKNWTTQLHIGALRNNNSRFLKILGPNSGFDAIADYEIAYPLARFLDRLDQQHKLGKTVIYTLNPTANEVIAALIGCFQDDSVPGKIQFGSGWWFNDQKDGMIRQMEALSNLGLLSRFIGMLTDSRSFLSYPRHEYFRRILCNLIGQDVDNGELPNDLGLLGQIVQDISYNNAVRYFGIELSQ